MNGFELKKKRKLLGLTQKEFANSVGLSFRTISDFENGKEVTESTLKLIESFFNGKANSPPTGNAKPVEHSEVVEAPVLLKAQAKAHFIDKDWKENVKDLPTVWIPKEYDNGYWIVTEIDGESMYNRDDRRSLQDGDKVLCKELQSEHWKSKLHLNRFTIWLIVHPEKGAFVKEIINHDTETGQVTCHSLNSNKNEYPNFNVQLNDVIALYSVRKIINRNL